jgi:ribonuclease P protein component
MTLKHSLHPKRQDPRVAVVVSKKVYKRAVGRNRIRRRVYEAVRQELPRIKDNADLVLVIFSADVRTIPADELTQTVRQLFEEAGVYKK